jgi:glycosyltransferase involved in cell wall biosynthesis
MTTLFPSLEAGLAESRKVLESFCASVTFLPIDRIQRPWGKQLTALEALVTGDSYTASWLVSGTARRRIAEQIAKNHYDLVHFDTIGLAPYRNLVRGSAMTLTHHNIESHMMLRRADNTGNPLAKAYFKHEGRVIAKLERDSAQDFGTHITCSELDSDRLRKLIPDVQAVAIPNGVDCEFFTPASPPQRANSLVFVGTMNWYPNIDAVLFFLKEVWPLLKEKIPTLTMDIAGTNPPESVVTLGKSLPGVTVHGYVDDVRPMIDSAAVFVCPIRDGGGTKLKILDAFAMKKCVVAHPIACEGINATPGKDIVFASTPAEFVAEIERLLADEPARRALGAAARDLVEREYSFRAIGKEFSQVIEGVVARHRQPA